MLTFSAGAELNPRVIRTKWVEVGVWDWWGSLPRSLDARLLRIIFCIRICRPSWLQGLLFHNVYGRCVCGECLRQVLIKLNLVKGS